MADVFELHELAIRSLGVSTTDASACFYFKREEPLKSSSKKEKEKKKTYTIFLSWHFFVPLGFKVWDEYLWLCTVRNWLANICWCFEADLTLTGKANMVLVFQEWGTFCKLNLHTKVPILQVVLLFRMQLWPVAHFFSLTFG